MASTLDKHVGIGMWEAYEDECGGLAAAEARRKGLEASGGCVVSFELEAVFDAEAWSPTHRALRARLRDGGVVTLEASLAYDGDATVEDAFEAVRAALRDDEACFVLFRTAVWTLWTWAPPGAPDAQRYLAARDALRGQLGGDVRVPHAAAWTEVPTPRSNGASRTRGPSATRSS